jgi:glyoxylase-like metal-dependent hydrolase (beta-lactamase superfamily II)
MNEKIKIIELGFVNAFLVRTKNVFVLIDTGLTQQWEKLQIELTSAGCLPDKLKLVVITHGDFDHTGNCAKLQEKYKAKIAMHQDDSFMVENGVFLKRKIRTLLGRIIILLSRLRHRRVSFNKFKPDIFLRDGQSLKEYGFDAKVIHLPGHTKGSIGILTDEGNLFAGDTLVNSTKPDIAIFINNVQELKNSISKLKKMNIKKVYPGHGKIFLFSDLKIKI